MAELTEEEILAAAAAERTRELGGFDANEILAAAQAESERKQSAAARSRRLTGGVGSGGLGTVINVAEETARTGLRAAKGAAGMAGTLIDFLPNTSEAGGARSLAEFEGDPDAPTAGETFGAPFRAAEEAFLTPPEGFGERALARISEEAGAAGGPARGIQLAGKGIRAAGPVVRDLPILKRLAVSAAENPVAHYGEEFVSAAGAGFARELDASFYGGEHDFAASFAGSFGVTGAVGVTRGLVRRGVPVPGSETGERTTRAAVRSLSDYLYVVSGKQPGSLADDVARGVDRTSVGGVSPTSGEVLEAAGSVYAPEIEREASKALSVKSRIALRQRRNDEFLSNETNPVATVARQAAEDFPAGDEQDVLRLIDQRRIELQRASDDAVAAANEEVRLFEQATERFGIDLALGETTDAASSTRAADAIRTKTKEVYNKVFFGHPEGRGVDGKAPGGLAKILDDVETEAETLGISGQLSVLRAEFGKRVSKKSGFDQQDLASSKASAVLRRLEALEIVDEPLDELNSIGALAQMLDGEAGTDTVAWRDLAAAERHISSILQRHHGTPGGVLSNTELGFVSDMQSSIEATFDDIAKGSDGLAKYLSQERKSARAAWAEQSRKFRDGIMGRFTSAELGQSFDGLSIDTFFVTGNNGQTRMRKFMEAFGEDDEVRGMMLAYVISKARDKSLFRLADGSLSIDPKKLDDFLKSTSFGQSIEEFPEAKLLFKDRREAIKTMNKQLEGARVDAQDYEKLAMTQVASKAGRGGNEGVFRTHVRDLIIRGKNDELLNLVDLAHSSGDTAALSGLRRMVVEDLAEVAGSSNPNALYGFINDPALLLKTLDDRSDLLRELYKDHPEHIERIRSLATFMEQARRSGTFDEGEFEELAKGKGFTKLLMNNFRSLVSPIWSLFTRTLRGGFAASAVAAVVNEKNAKLLFNEAFIHPEVMEALGRVSLNDPGGIVAIRRLRLHLINNGYEDALAGGEAPGPAEAAREFQEGPRAAESFPQGQPIDFSAIGSRISDTVQGGLSAVGNALTPPPDLGSLPAPDLGGTFTPEEEPIRQVEDLFRGREINDLFRGGR